MDNKERLLKKGEHYGCFYKRKDHINEDGTAR